MSMVSSPLRCPADDDDDGIDDEEDDDEDGDTFCSAREASWFRILTASRAALSL